MKLKTTIETFKSIMRECKIRDNHILNAYDRKTTENIVNLHYYTVTEDEKVQNLGDYLSKVIYEYMLSLKGISPNQKVSKTKHLYALGSILQAGYTSATVWGSGYLRKDRYSKSKNRLWCILRKLDIRAVRGPETRDFLLYKGYKVPNEVYGDPAIIMPLIYQPEIPETKKEYSIVKHYTDETECDNVIDILTDDYKGFIDQIVSSKKIISSSLHGMILAEVYGVPAVLYAANPTDEWLFKFRDYYYGTGRFDFPVATTLEEAYQITPLVPPDFTEQRKKLMDVFPYDLWE